jgi:hypothetical protein
MARAAAPSSDSQLWSELDITHAFSTNFSATVMGTTRLGVDLPNPTLTAGGLQLDYRIGSWVASGTGDYVSIRNAENGAHTTVWLPAVALTYRAALGALEISDRNRVEQLEGIPGSPARYRNRAGASWPVSRGRHPTEVFISDEVFYDFSRARWTRNRAQAGLQFDLGSGADLQIFYMRQNNDYGAPDRFNVLGLTLQLQLTSRNRNHRAS